MSLFDNMPGRKRSKVKLPRTARLVAPGDVTAAPEPTNDAESPVVEPTPAPEIEAVAEPTPAHAVAAPEPAPAPAPVAAPEPAPLLAPVTSAPTLPESEIEPVFSSAPELAPVLFGAEAPAPEPVAEPIAETEAVEAPGPVHEKVEGIDDIADVVIPGAAVAGTAAGAGSLFKPKRPKVKRAVGLPKAKLAAADKPVKIKQPKPPKPPKEHKRKSAHITREAEVVGLSGSRRLVKQRPERANKEPRTARPRPERRKLAITAGFRDPVRRPRYVLWSISAVLGLAAVMIVALGATSTRWFCSEGCHKVQDDTITAYQHSSHSEISCMACHMPVGGNPVVFVLHKAEALGELYLTVTDGYELPLNGQSHVALTMASTQCTQCHDIDKRTITPTAGIKIDHKAHAKKGVECAVCHNRIAHNEDFELALTDPQTGERNKKHDNFMSMTACFRCHTQNATSPGPLKAPGECVVCHPADFQLKPASHLEADFFPKGHAKLGREAAERVEGGTSHAEGEGHEGGVTQAKNEGAENAETAENPHGEGLGLALPKANSINECSTCHSEKFCSDCHGLTMPHPSDFRKSHGPTGKKNPKACTMCHGSADRFCDECHHKTSIKRTYDTKRDWFSQHPDAVDDVGATTCFKCHEPTYCARCHVKGTPQ